MKNLFKRTLGLKVVTVFMSVMLLLSGCGSNSVSNSNNTTDKNSNVTVNNKDAQNDKNPSDNKATENTSDNKNNKPSDNKSDKENASAEKDLFEGYTLIEVDGGDQSGHREPNVVVDIGFGDREYYAFTNEYGQLVKVVAKEVILQDDDNEPVTSDGRYYHDEAKVPGVESKTLDEGHVIADSLGGVSNAYNITPQNSTLNRHGDQAYMEKAIRDAGGCTDFTAIITYPDTKTQIPSHYSYTYTINGNVINDEFDNVDPDEVNKDLGISTSTEESKKDPAVEEESKNEEASSSVIVYVTDTGEKYHRDGCSSLNKSKHERKLSDLSSNYTPCKKCNPPSR